MVQFASFKVSEVKLWWPIGFGDQVLYKVKVVFGDQTIEKNVGLRTVDLVQDAVEFSVDDADLLGQPKATGAHFYFKVNGVPIFAKGANFIPIDLFESRVTEQDREYII